MCAFSPVGSTITASATGASQACLVETHVQSQVEGDGPALLPFVGEVEGGVPQGEHSRTSQTQAEGG